MSKNLGNSLMDGFEEDTGSDKVSIGGVLEQSLMVGFLNVSGPGGISMQSNEKGEPGFSQLFHCWFETYGKAKMTTQEIINQLHLDLQDISSCEMVLERTTA